ncbi:MAG: helix-turn-helix domain-containing protein [Chloroflexota bacterium]
MDKNNIHSSDLLSVAEASELLRVSRVTVHRWIEKDKLTAIRIGNSRFVLKKEVEAMCTAQDGADLQARLSNILARRTPGWTFTFVGEPTDHGPNTMVAIGPDSERITFRFEVLEESKSTEQDKSRQETK